MSLKQDVICYHCEKSCTKYYDGDFCYDNGLYVSNEESTVQVNCPNCKESFFVECVPSTLYQTDISENYD